MYADMHAYKYTFIFIEIYTERYEDIHTHSQNKTGT